MLLRQLTSLSTVSRVARQTSVRSMSVDYGDHHRSPADIMKHHKTTINDLPVPAGSWQENYNKRNQGFNMMLGGGFLAMVATFAVMYSQGTLYLHGKPDLKNVHIDPR